MITNCIHCGCFIDTDLADDSPAEHIGNSGYKDQPRSPGEYDDICDDCNYTNGMSGGPDGSPTYYGNHSEWE